MSLKHAKKAALNQQLAALPKMNREALRKLWEDLFQKPPNPALRREVLIPVLAYRLQELALGSLKASAESRLRALIDGEHNRAQLLPLRPKPGTRFVREWQGKLHEVSVLPEGHEYQGQIYRSLSEIARTITGTRWSGPAFFGLKRREREKAA